ncbi:MAG: A/G-specific adenine glycosylase [Microbacter sp.]
MHQTSHDKNDKNTIQPIVSTSIEHLDQIPLAETLLAWYDQHKRDLPWRNTTDPYTIWISEIILQQTRVEQGLGYFVRFMERFPDIQSVAVASEQEILNYWKGLGYYGRARNIHHAARLVMEQFEGKFPTQYDEIRSLPGIGPYTAAAIASFAFHLPYPVIDGNVMRFLTRYFGIFNTIDEAETKKTINQLAMDLMDKQHPDLYNQAIMEFGALQCVPHSPSCAQCPFQGSCFAAANQMVNQFPIKKKKLQPRDRYFYYFCMVHEQTVLLQKRINKDIWQHLYEFPLLETPEPLAVEKVLASPFLQSYVPFQVEYISSPVKHLLTHQKIYAIFFIIRTDRQLPSDQHHPAVRVDQLIHYPIPKLIISFINSVLLKQSY